LSSQLYEKSTHFLLELIQNADDNNYTTATPTLSFSYKPGCLRIDCNEVGFDASNVAAICGVSQSTKSGKSSDGEFIGEKGIGFKSVFKVADAVWIASNEFTFKFDRTRPLGVITPLWEEFPEQTESSGTSIFLQLSTSYDEQNLIKELYEFDSNLLIFLRRIKEINIDVNCAEKSLRKKQIRKTQYEQESDRVIVLETGADSLEYLIRTHIVEDLPQEVRRKGWTETKILLAFPLPAKDEKPVLKPQNVYAFLPIRNYGFKFLIQADFILTASREDIESTLSWNLRIRDALSEAFLSSMLHFNEGILKYVWPFYLPSLSVAMSGFFEPAIGMILSRIGESPVFESSAGNMVQPSALVHVPDDFCVNGEPFTLCDATKDRYLSSHYASWVIEAMASVGVSHLKPRQFLEDLATLIATDAESFQKRSSKWQAQLATTLVKLSTDAELMPLIQDLAIIPLNNGTWTAARDNNIFFAKSDASLEIPDGIRILIVENDAESDSNRRTLFTSLGVKAWEAPEICRLILDVHASTDFQPGQLNTSQIISHAVFLYRSKWQPPKGADLWFATARNERVRGREVYISGSANADSAAARLFAVLEKQFPVIHTDYLTAFTEETEWLDWLVQNLGLSKIPRLVTPVVEPRPQPMEVPLQNETPSRIQTDPPSNEIQARMVDPRPDIDYYEMDPDAEASSTIVHRRRVSIPYQPRTTEPFPSFDEPVLQGNATEPFPSFDSAAMQENSTEPFPSFTEPVVRENPLFTVSPRHLLAPDRIRRVPSKITGACNQCQMGTGIMKCDGMYPACGTCIRQQLKCYYPNDVTQESAGVPVGEKAPVPVLTTNNTVSGGGYTRRVEHTDVNVENLQDSAKDIDIDLVTTLRKYSFSKSVATTLVTQDPAPADLYMNENLVLPEQLVEEHDEPEELLFDLSEEFKSMLHECDSSDIFQLIRDNWHHYSQWVEGAHMKWQSQEYASASIQLKNKVGASLVQTIRGPLPLNETVLAKLDTELDQSKAAPALQLHEPENSEWSVLANFGVVVKSDVHYYLQCLTTLCRDEAPDIDVIGYIYEQLQSMYTGNEGIIR
jgi:hypothetical protein